MIRRLSSAAGGLARRISGSRPPTIQALPRERADVAATAKDLANGRIPTILFSRTRTPNLQHLTTDRRQIRSILARSPFLFTTKFPLKVRAGEGSRLVLNSSTVIPYKVHKNEKGKIIRLEVARAEDGVAVKVSVPIVYKGEDVCPGLKKGGRLEKMRPAVTFLCPIEHLPRKLVVDLTKLDIKSKVLIDDIKIHHSLKLMDRGGRNVPICKIWGPPPGYKPVAEATDETAKLVPEACTEETPKPVEEATDETAKLVPEACTEETPKPVAEATDETAKLVPEACTEMPKLVPEATEEVKA